MRKRPYIAALFAGALGLGLTLGGPVAAKDAEKPGIGAEVDEAVQQALRTLERFIDVFPGYHAPEVTPEGDIIIRRIRPKTTPEQPENPDQRRI